MSHVLVLQVLQPPTGYIPIRTPARKLIATPTPMAGTPQGFRMQTPDNKTSVVDMQPKGNLPMMKPDDMQYFDKLLDDVDEEALSPEEQKERKIMKLLLKIKNGTPPMRKVNHGLFYTPKLFSLLVATSLLNHVLSPYKPRVLFMGHMQTVQTQIRCSRMRHLISLHCLLTECSIKI